ncbi:MAG: peptide chain release factor N(5)-glutamine methyltransferase [Dongiaceae bacterium]
MSPAAAGTPIGGLVAATAERLRLAGIEEHRREARLLAGAVLGADPATLVAHPERRVDPAAAARLAAAAARRAAREPLSHILGRREFWSLSFAVDGSVLDPRPDSETLVAAALALVPDRSRPLRLLDLGTGSGCLLLALLSELPAATGLGIDASPAALAVAAGNAGRLGLSARADFRPGDWAGGLAGPFDLVLSNPPYIPSAELPLLAPEVARYEPRLALDGGPDGLDCYRRLAPQLGALLREGGAALLELGAGQAAAVAAIMAAAGLRAAGLEADAAGRPRCLVLRRGADGDVSNRSRTAPSREKKSFGKANEPG